MPSALDYRWALGPDFGDLVVLGGAGSGFGQSRASLATISWNSAMDEESVVNDVVRRMLLQVGCEYLLYELMRIK